MEGLDSQSVEVACPQCGGHDFKRWDYRHPVILHWLLNPGLCFNELVLGQRLPKVMLICNSCQQALADRTYVPCPSCHQLHSGRLWAGKDNFAHWFGYVCPSCGESVPCLWNIWSLLVLAITCPVWFLPSRILKRKWIELEKRRIAAAVGKSRKSAEQIRWIYLGVVAWGGLMWLLFCALILIVTVCTGRWHVLWFVPAMLPLFLLGGLAWGLAMRWFMNR